MLSLLGLWAPPGGLPNLLPTSPAPKGRELLLVLSKSKFTFPPCSLRVTAEAPVSPTRQAPSPHPIIHSTCPPSSPTCPQPWRQGAPHHHWGSERVCDLPEITQSTLTYMWVSPLTSPPLFRVQQGREARPELHTSSPSLRGARLSRVTCCLPPAHCCSQTQCHIQESGHGALVPSPTTSPCSPGEAASRLQPRFPHLQNTWAGREAFQALPASTRCSREEMAKGWVRLLRAVRARGWDGDSPFILKWWGPHSSTRMKLH